MSCQRPTANAGNANGLRGTVGRAKNASQVAWLATHDTFKHCGPHERGTITRKSAPDIVPVTGHVF